MSLLPNVMIGVSELLLLRIGFGNKKAFIAAYNYYRLSRYNHNNDHHMQSFVINKILRLFNFKTLTDTLCGFSSIQKKAKFIFCFLQNKLGNKKFTGFIQIDVDIP